MCTNCRRLFAPSPVLSQYSCVSLTQHVCKTISKALSVLVQMPGARHSLMGGALPVLGRRARVSRGMQVRLSYQKQLLSARLHLTALVQNLLCSEPLAQRRSQPSACRRWLQQRRKTSSSTTCPGKRCRTASISWPMLWGLRWAPGVCSQLSFALLQTNMHRQHW